MADQKQQDLEKYCYQNIDDKDKWRDCVDRGPVVVGLECKDASKEACAYFNKYCDYDASKNVCSNKPNAPPFARKIPCDPSITNGGCMKP